MGELWGRNWGVDATVNHAVLVVMGINGLLALLAFYGAWRLGQLGQTWATWADVLEGWNRQLPHTLRHGGLLQARLQMAQVRWHYIRLQRWQRRWHQVQRGVSLLWQVYRRLQRWGWLDRHGQSPTPVRRRWR